MLRTFADIPDEVGRRIDAGERLVLILLDGFGLEFLRQHADHPLVQGLEITPLRSQFPSTTTAHVTTLCFGLPLVLAPGPTFYETLKAASLVMQPREIEHSSITRMATRGAAVRGFDELVDGLQAVAHAFSNAEGPATRFCIGMRSTGRDIGTGLALRSFMTPREQRLTRSGTSWSNCTT
jgi:hypothetical protein